MTKGNLHALVKSGIVIDPQIIYSTWSNILVEYSEAIGDSEYLLYVKITKELDAIKLKYQAVLSALLFLRPGIYSKFLCDNLNKELGGNYKFDYTNDNNYQKDLKGCKSRSAALKMQIDMKQIQYNGILNKSDGKPPTDAYYNGIIVALEDCFKIPQIDEDKLTVAKFCQWIKRYNAKNK